ncbi:MAG: hypothetical protein DCC55_29835 [Chloroflexi bacterium]|nr:MAG: hypothetical protein DCC55_29835 [Chloroflexota bacterium]
MSSDSYVALPGDASTREVWSLNNWLPRIEQVRAALQLRIDEVIGATGDEGENEADLATTSMRQGMGLVFVLGVLAGALPFVVNWISATRAGTALPLLRLVQNLNEQGDQWATLPLPLDIWVDTARTLAGVDPRAPGWLVAFLSALGEWINWPLNWLALWLVYGLGVLVVSKLLGGPTTLQRFYAATAYAFTPLLLAALSPIPCLGALATFVGIVWMVVMYIHAVYVVTGLDMGRAILSVFLPAALVAVVGVIMLGATILSLLQLLI